MKSWNPTQYLKFEQQRTQPAIDLANRIPLTHPQHIIDIGCGPGNSTAVLAQRYPNAHILGIDTSTSMIETAQATYPDIQFLQCDAGTQLHTLNQQFDIVFSNATIQWIPNHPALLANMFALLRPGGTLAVQTPNQSEAPVHRIMQTLAYNPTWQGRFQDVPRVFHNLPQMQYFDVLSALTEDFDIWQTTYYHAMPNHAAIIEWYRGTGLKPYLDALQPGDRPLFEAEVYTAITETYPLQANGQISFGFVRLFFIAQHP